MAQKPATAPTAPAKKTFKLPHLLWIMLGLILIMSLLTYVIPAGQFATDPVTKQLLGDKFAYVGHQTPVTPARALMMFMDGLTGSGVIIFSVMVGGAGIGVILATGAVDKFLNWAVFKLKDKGTTVLVPLLFVMLVYLGGFGGGDQLIAIVPIGVVFAKKMRLDPITAVGMTTFATLTGFGTGPTKLLIPQTMMGVPVYSGFGARFLSMNFFMIVALVYLFWYVKRVEKDPSKSFMGSDEWMKELDATDTANLKEEKLSWRTILIMLIFFGQYGVILYYTMGMGGKNVYPFMIAVQIVAGIICGFLGGMTMDQIGNEFAKGLAGMAFVGFVIGLARVVSLVMTEGKILHTIVYTLTRPLMGVPKALSTIGITAIISLINMLIPSASSKAAILIPIIKPITETLKIHPQIAVSAFQYGDGFTNIVSPALGWTVGSCAVAKVPFDKWVKFALPIVVVMMVLSFAWVYGLSAMGWTGLPG